MQQQQFDGRTVVVTGAGSGIGAATAQLLAGRGANVLAADRDLDTAARVADAIVTGGGSAVAVRCDVALASDWSALAETALGLFGGVDVVVNNAALQVKLPAHDQTQSEWMRQIEVGLVSVYHSVCALMPFLRKRNGCMVNVSSVHALFGFAGFSAYAAAKGGMVSLSRELAVEYGPEVRVNVVLPGPIDTPVWDAADEAYRDLARRSTAVGRFGSPAEVAAAIAFLASDDAAFISGASLLVDGGFSARKDAA